MAIVITETLPQTLLSNADLRDKFDIEPRNGLGIDIGCGPNRLLRAGYQCIRFDIRSEVDPDILGDARSLPFEDKTFDLVHSSHVLEHFPRAIWKHVLAEWIRVLRTDGEIWFNLPNIMWAAERLAIEKIIDEHVLNVLYGAQDNDFDYHYHGLTPDIMKIELEKHGLELFHFTTKSYNMFLGAKYKRA